MTPEAPHEFLIGCNGRGAQASSIDRPISLEEASIDEQFRLARDTWAEIDGA